MIRSNGLDRSTFGFILLPVLIRCVVRIAGFTVGRQEPSTTTKAAAAAVTGTGGCMYILFFFAFLVSATCHHYFSGVVITCSR